MTLWCLTYFCLFLGLAELKPLRNLLRSHFSQSQQIVELRRSAHHLKLIQEMLESGLVPDAETWKKIESFPAPWGKSLLKSLQELRGHGASILPTLIRIQKTIEEQAELIQEGKVKSAQAFGQALLGLVLVPGFGVLLYLLLPELSQSLGEFLLLMLFSMTLSSIAWVWMVSMVEQARFGNMKTENRTWILGVNVALERLLALISTGSPPDLAWRKTIDEMALYDPTLAKEWKSQIWDIEFSVQTNVQSECERLALSLGTELRRHIQTSLIEGRSCMDRIESLHRSFLLDLRMKIGHELTLLPNRTLKPLFILVLPSVMLLLGGSLFLCMKGFLS